MIRHLVLCGLGPGHLRLLAFLARQGVQNHADIGISLLTRQHRYIPDAALLKMVGTRRPVDPRKTDEHLARETNTEAAHLETLVQKSGVRWIDNSPQALDLPTKTLLLDDGRTLRFDWLSVEPEPVQNRDQIEPTLPGARSNGLFVRPREAFCRLWPQVQALAATRPLRFTVVLNLRPRPQMGALPQTTETTETTMPMSLEASALPQSPAAPPSVWPPFLQTPTTHAAADWPLEKSALELAFALRHAFKGSAVTLITGGAAIGEGMVPALQDRVHTALKKRQITVLRDAACAIAPGEVMLQSGARLACDVPLLMVTPSTPDWLTGSGLARNAQGQVQTDGALRSSSHPLIFVNAQDMAANARRLFQGLRGVIAGRPQTAATALPASQPMCASNTVHRVDCGDGRGIVAWRNWAVESWRLWRL